MGKYKFFKFDEPLNREWPEIVTLDLGKRYRYYNDKRQISGILYNPEIPIHKIIEIYGIILQLKWHCEHPETIPKEGMIIG